MANNKKYDTIIAVRENKRLKYEKRIYITRSFDNTGNILYS